MWLKSVYYAHVCVCLFGFVCILCILLTELDPLPPACFRLHSPLFSSSIYLWTSLPLPWRHSVSMCVSAVSVWSSRYETEKHREGLFYMSHFQSPGQPSTPLNTWQCEADWEWLKEKKRGSWRDLFNGVLIKIRLKAWRQRRGIVEGFMFTSDTGGTFGCSSIRPRCNVFDRFFFLVEQHAGGFCDFSESKLSRTLTASRWEFPGMHVCVIVSLIHLKVWHLNKLDVTNKYSCALKSSRKRLNCWICWIYINWEALNDI